MTQIPIHLKFGYAAIVEKDAIRKRLLDNGAADDIGLLFTVEQGYIDAHANDPPYRDRKVRTSPPSSFTKEELTRLVEHFENANDPVSASIARKAKTILER